MTEPRWTIEDGIRRLAGAELRGDIVEEEPDERHPLVRPGRFANSLKGRKYSIDYYQREYQWREKQVQELVNDLTGKFLEEYKPEHERRQVADYPHYFLGSIIVSRKDGVDFLVDGQQRLTSLTLLLIYLRRLQLDEDAKVDIDVNELVVSVKFGHHSFNLEVDEREDCMGALFDGQEFDPTDQPPSVQNLVARYGDIVDAFPEELQRDALPYFVDWLLENVHLVAITAHSDDDAYLIFETMNDRGLSLSPTDMLKGYLLANITDPDKRSRANDHWKARSQELLNRAPEVPADALKAWLRSQYATKIRERRTNARPEDFDRIGTEFHRWLREAAAGIGLTRSDDFYRFIERDFDFYSRRYMRVLDASEHIVDGLEHVAYNADHGFTLQNMLLLAPLTPDDSDEASLLKMRLVARFVDILLARRIWNARSTAYSTMQYAMFLVMRDIRRLDPVALAERLVEILGKERETFSTNENLSLHQQNRYALHRILARMTTYVETESGQPNRYVEYARGSGKQRCEIEHIWANKPEEHEDEFDSGADFADRRNVFGALLLLPKSFNASYGALPYEKKLPQYDSQNLLARSLHPLCYQNNPGFLRFVKLSGLPFRPHEHFKTADLAERHKLYGQIAERLWDPQEMLREVNE